MPIMSAPNTLTATEIARQIDCRHAHGRGRHPRPSRRIDKRDADVLAWSHLAREAALERARTLDRGPRQGLLHGVPIGVKDIIDSYDQPTTYGSPIYKTHQPIADAATVALARHAGAILLGKTVTTEFANRHPGVTRNPHNPAHTPGGSSSGSAAAVADFQVVLATGTQTGGSVIRPAAFCGVYGYKPSYGHFPVAGMKANTEWLDTIGAYARSLDDIALFRAALMAIPHRPIQKIDSPPRVAVCFTPHKDELEPEGVAAIEEAAAKLAKAGARVTDFEMPPRCSRCARPSACSPPSMARAPRPTRRAASTTSCRRASRKTRSPPATSSTMRPGSPAASSASAAVPSSMRSSPTST
jgi:Asp-tRNA(Asn)/Glu-tRNA(Gln) amidotransferase A subunit family amidase